MPLVASRLRSFLAAFSRRIDTLDWMMAATKARAKAKLGVLKVGVGYPDRWIDYSGLDVVRGDAFGNLQRAEMFEYRRNLRKLGRPVDRSEWVMTPQTVNAVNLPVMNAMNFPAGILQPPYFDPARPLALDYGAIGAIIGHEISHSFDDQGAEFDAEGRLRNWWTDEDLSHFRAAAAKLVKQYDAYRPLPDLAVKGKLTLSENIADVAGLAASLDAYRLSLGGEPRRWWRGCRATSSSSSPLRSPGGESRASRTCACRSSATATRRANTASTPCATSKRGARRSTSSRAGPCTWRPPTASACGDGACLSGQPAGWTWE